MKQHPFSKDVILILIIILELYNFIIYIFYNLYLYLVFYNL